MKKYMLLAIIFTLIFTVSGCSNNKPANSISSSNYKNNYVTTKNITYDEKNLETSYRQPMNLTEPSTDDAKNFNTSIKNGSVIMVSKNNSNEVYNISMLDKFIDAFSSGKPSYVRVIKVMIDINGTYLVNKLDAYETDGKIIKDTSYDTYSNKNKFVPASPIYFSQIVKTGNGNLIRYAALESKNTPDYMGATIISFDKSCIKN